MSKHNQTRTRRLRISPALIVSMLALFAALSGAAVALPGQSTVNSGDIKDNTIKSQDLKDGLAVANVDVVPESIQSTALAPDSVGSSELAPNSVNASELADGIHAHSTSLVVAGGVNQNAAYNVETLAASCGGGEELISGSAHWSNNGANEELFISEIQLDHNAESVAVRAGNDTDQDRTLVAVAHCLG